MSIDRSWMQKRVAESGRGLSVDFRNGVDTFLAKAFSASSFVDGNKIRCPCRSCVNLHWRTREEVYGHLLNKGFLPTYTRWCHHGEPLSAGTSTTSSYFEMHGDVSESTGCRQMILEAGGPQINWETILEPSDDSVIHEEPNREAQDFYKLLREAEEPLYEGHEKHTKLSATTELLQYKTEEGCTEKAFDKLLKLIKSFLPEDDTLPDTFYEVKKTVKRLGLGYEKIDVCENDCILYYGAYKDLKQCPTCHKSRYKPKAKAKGKDVPHKILRYFPVGCRLQRLYMSSKTAADMRWHSTRRVVDGELRHPADGEAWKQFDRDHPSFGEGDRHVRLGWAADGFCPFGMSSKAYSCWPVITVPYNLPPWKCMKEPYMFLSLLIPGPKSPSKDFGVFLQPLIDELNSLWETGLVTYDASLKDNFTMRAALMWTINDFPALGMHASWSCHGSLACPVCMGGSKGTQLKYGGKPTFFGCHRSFLPSNHRFRSITGDFYKERDRKSAPRRLLGLEVLRRMNQISFPLPGKAFKDKPVDGFGKEHNFTGNNVFFQLPYWKTNLLRHNLDVMHIEKNVFDNVFNTVMNVQGKTKDNPKTRLDLVHMGIRHQLHPRQEHGKTILPKAAYTLTREQIKLVCQWVKDLKLPDGYVSNISKCCNLSDCRFYGLKSHDCHVFMQRLIPIAFRDLLPPPVVDALTELSHFFRDLCSTILKESDLLIMEQKIIETICKLEMIFPPSFFDSMEHLPIHLAYEARMGGPVQYRWMYPFERCMRRLKAKVHNKARVEGSIAEMYVIDEISTFCSMYFKNDVETKHNRMGRNEVGAEVRSGDRLSIFKHAGEKALGEGVRRVLTPDEYNAAALYTLLNMEEVEEYIQAYDAILEKADPHITGKRKEEMRNQNFLDWFKQRVLGDDNVDLRLKYIAYGPSNEVYVYDGYIVNGFRFHSKQVEGIKSTANSGVLVKGSCYNELYDDWYGQLEEVIKLKYLGDNFVFLFKCHWFDITRKGMRIDKHKSVRVNTKSRAYANEPFIFASQATQVYYARGVLPKKEPDWYTVIKTKSQSSYDMPDETNSAITLDMIKPLVFQAIYGPEVPYDPSSPSFRSVIAYEVSQQLAAKNGSSSGVQSDQDDFETDENVRQQGSEDGTGDGSD